MSTIILKNIWGRRVSRTTNPYLIKWDEPSRSGPQTRVKEFLRPYWKVNHCVEEFPVLGTKMKVDIMNFSKRIAIEVHGTQHEKFNKFFHKTRLNWLKSMKRDFKKVEWLESNEFTVWEIYDHETKDLSPSFFKEKFNFVF
jgi:hypothetical protein